jgi:ATP-dependent DNA ligase
MAKLHSVASARLPDFVEPMKAKLVASMPAGDWIYEIKFDGYRALAMRDGIETRVLSRSQKDLGNDAQCANANHSDFHNFFLAIPNLRPTLSCFN